MVIERHHELGVDLQLASRPLHGGLKHFKYHFCFFTEIMMLKQSMLNAALSINLFLLFPPFAHVLTSSSRLGKPVLSPSLTEQHIVDHLLVCLAVAVGQRGKRVPHLYQSSQGLFSKQQKCKHLQFQEHICPCTGRLQQLYFLDRLLLRVSYLRSPATEIC